MIVLGDKTIPAAMQKSWPKNTVTSHGTFPSFAPFISPHSWLLTEIDKKSILKQLP
jgi:hypothetical protein